MPAFTHSFIICFVLERNSFGVFPPFPRVEHSVGISHSVQLWGARMNMARVAQGLIVGKRMVQPEKDT